MENQIDMTFSVAVDEATEKMLAFVSDLYKDYTPDVVEVAVERGMLEIRDTKARLYASILAKNIKQEQQLDSNSPRVSKTGTVQEMADDLKQHGVDVDMK